MLFLQRIAFRVVASEGGDTTGWAAQHPPRQTQESHAHTDISAQVIVSPARVLQGEC